MKPSASAFKSVTVQKLTVRSERVWLLDPEKRYAYYMLGHLFNELMFLQKLLGFVLPNHGDDRSIRMQPEIGQAMFLFRLAAGKLWEAKLVLGTKEFSAVLRSSFLPLIPEGAQRLKALLRRLSEAAWLKELRNCHSFHYPSFSEWHKLVEPAGEWADDEIFLSEQSGNVFYAGADAMAQHWMFGQLNPDDPRSAVEPMINELIQQIARFKSLIEDLLRAFIVDRLLAPGQVPQAVGSVASPRYDDVKIPFWTYMKAKERAIAE